MHLQLVADRAAAVDTCSLAAALQIEVYGDLVDKCIPGDVVTVCGVVCGVNVELASGRTSKSAKNSSVYTLYVRANSVSNAKDATQGTVRTTYII
jgi:DNA replicative helicase MCM subunit Mcm2 (Cdc46/Mcm family)